MTETVLCLSCGSQMERSFPGRWTCPDCNTGWDVLDGCESYSLPLAAEPDPEAP